MANVMIKKVKIGGKIFSVGDKFRGKQNLGTDRLIKPSEVVRLMSIKVVDSREVLGIHSFLAGVRGNPWCSLDGAVQPGTGLWVDKESFMELFDVETTDTVVIRRDFNFKNRNLKGMKGNLINKIPTRDGYFVELETDVGGGSADGLCGTGRCVVVPEYILDWQPETISDWQPETKDDTVPLPCVEEAPELVNLSYDGDSISYKGTLLHESMTRKFKIKPRASLVASSEEKISISEESIFDSVSIEEDLSPPTVSVYERYSGEPYKVRSLPKKPDIHDAREVKADTKGKVWKDDKW